MFQELLLSHKVVFALFVFGIAVKSSMMVGNDWKSVWNTLRTNGPFWFYRGYIPAAMNQGLIMVLQMPIIEELRRILGVGTI